jgi:cellulose synthase/poly-beta-1,6-N-acetylglucosamine synthase-like glycosyltransferase
MTEDIEITWHLQAEGYKVKMAVPARAYTVAPSKFKDWLKQRNRWNIGGLQTIGKYNRNWFKKGMLGNFILPFFVSSWIIGLFGLFVFFYRIIRGAIIKLFSTTYSVQTQTTLFRFSDLNLTPNVLVFFGLVLFFLGLWFVFVALANMQEKEHKKENIFVIAFYAIFYTMVYPIILITSTYKFLRGYRKW